MNKEELLSKITLFCEDLYKNDDPWATIYGFKPDYIEKSDILNYKSFRLNVETKNVLDYFMTLILNIKSKIAKCDSIEELNYSNQQNTLNYLSGSSTSQFYNKIEHFKNSFLSTTTQKFTKKVLSDIKFFLIKTKINGKEFYIVSKGVATIKKHKLYLVLEEDDLLENKNNKTKIQNNNNLIEMPQTPTIFLYENDAFILTNLAETIFGIESSLKENANIVINDIFQAGFIDENSKDLFLQTALKGKNFYKFQNYDNSKKEAILNKSPNIINFLKTRDIMLENGVFNIQNEEKAVILQKLLCNEIKGDIDNPNKVYDAPGNKLLN